MITRVIFEFGLVVFQGYTVGMTTTLAVRDPVLLRLREVLEAAYGPRLQRVVLFGSRARGDARPDSDYDVALFLHGMEDRDAEVSRLPLLQVHLMEETDAFAHTMPSPAGAWQQRTPLMHEIRAEGIDL